MATTSMAAQHQIFPENPQPYPFPIEESSYLITQDFAEIIHIFDPSVNMLVYQREVKHDLQDFVKHIEFPNPIQIRLKNHLAQESIENALPNVVRDLNGYSAFVEDLVNWIDHFHFLTDANQIGLRLASLQKPMCPGFHVDKVTLRLVCTYDGPCTEWLDNRHVNRAFLGKIDPHTPDEDSPLILNTEAVQSMSCFDVGLLKGESWKDTQGNDNQGNGIVHRSPPIRSAPYQRLLLTLDCLG